MPRSTIESFKPKLRDECLNEQWFETLHQARVTVVAWRRDYNEARPHNSLGRIPPAQFAEQHRRLAGDAAPRANDKTNPIN
jgi:putative transposase